MKAIELETQIDQAGNIHLPERYRHAYGKSARLVLLLPDAPSEEGGILDPMRYAGTVDWPLDGLEYQVRCRDEWS